MSNNKEHSADYQVKTTFGHCPLGFKQTSGDTNTLAHKASKLIKTPLNTPINRRYNDLVNEFVDVGNENAIDRLIELKNK